MTTRGNLATLVLIITLGCSHAYVGKIIIMLVRLCFFEITPHPSCNLPSKKGGVRSFRILQNSSLATYVLILC